MSEPQTADLRYPIGPFVAPPGALSADERAVCIREIAAAPRALREAVRGLSAAQLHTPYRPGGWTVRQVVHHLADSHANATIRFRLALTEDEPTIRPYDEVRWAELPDVGTVPVETSLALLDALHERWAALLELLPEEAWRRGYVHPGHGRRFPLDEALASYAWHGRHHVAHVTTLRERMAWTE